MSEQINARKAAGQPAGEQVNRQREAVHFGEQRHQKGREGAKRTPVTGSAWLGKAERENDENRGVNNHQRPKAVGGWFLRAHNSPFLACYLSTLSRVALVRERCLARPGTRKMAYKPLGTGAARWRMALHEKLLLGPKGVLGSSGAYWANLRRGKSRRAEHVVLRLTPWNQQAAERERQYPDRLDTVLVRYRLTAKSAGLPAKSRTSAGCLARYLGSNIATDRACARARVVESRALTFDDELPAQHAHLALEPELAGLIGDELYRHRLTFGQLGA